MESARTAIALLFRCAATGANAAAKPAVLRGAVRKGMLRPYPE